jgi:MerR family mercuric resistance operon transcriptional regulator
MYTISQLAKSAGVNVETIRYYERQNLIEQPNTPLRGYRQYPEATLTKVLFIKRAQHLGFTLSEIDALILTRITYDHGGDMDGKHFMLIVW